MANSHYQEARELTQEFVSKLTSTWSDEERAEVKKVLNGIFFKRAVYAHPSIDKRLAMEIRDKHRAGACGGGECDCVARYDRLRARYQLSTSV